MADHLYDAGAASRNGADDIAWAKSQALNAITEAEQTGFTVGEDLSVTDRSMVPLLSTARAARQAQARAFGAVIRAAAENLAAVDKLVAGQVATALAPLGENGFVDTSTPTVQAFDFPMSPPPPDPGGDRPNPKDPNPNYPNCTNDGKYGDGNSQDGRPLKRLPWTNVSKIWESQSSATRSERPIPAYSIPKQASFRGASTTVWNPPACAASTSASRQRHMRA